MNALGRVTQTNEAIEDTYYIKHIHTDRLLTVIHRPAAAQLVEG